MIRIIAIQMICFCSLLSFGQKTKEAKPALSKSDMIKFDFAILANKKALIKAKDKSLIPAYNQLIKDADKDLNFKPVSVMDKTDIPPSGSKHDFMSIGPFWWPNPNKPNGVPYIRKDGEINPEVKNYPDKENFPKLTEVVNRLALTYFYSNNEKYAKHVAKLLQVWFIDTATKMNPNLKFGQAIKGVTEGRAEGVLDGRYVINIIDAVELIKKSKSWSKENQNSIKKWFIEFSNWINTSKIGVEEKEAKNNHGVWFDATALRVALFINDNKLANSIAQSAANRLNEQMDNDGNFPLELERTTSLHYTAFILDAFTIIAQLSQKTNINLWTLETKSKKSLEKGYENLFPYLNGTKEWTWKQIKPFNISNAFQLLLKASTKYNCKSCMDIIKKNASNFEKLTLNLL